MYDFVIVGAGIVGLTLAREIKLRNPALKVLIVEKESSIGRHASGRNSGVLHSGIYYPAGSLKAKVCASGAKAMREYCEARGLPLKCIGKVVVPTREEDDPQLDLLLERANVAGARAELIDEKQLLALEPEAHSASGRALWSPDTAVIDPMLVMRHLVHDLESQGVYINYGQFVQKVDPKSSTIVLRGETVSYGHLINAAGLYADKVAKSMGIGQRYTLLPFKGRYFALAKDSGLKINHLIYPVPDLRMPFLGVHYTTTISGDTYLGPTATPIFGRENYKGIQGIRFGDAASISYHLAKQYALDCQGFRLLSHTEMRRYFKKYFTQAAQLLTPRLRAKHLVPCEKVGIRPQLLDTESNELVSDFLIETTRDSTHILNAISPAFTGSLVFAEYVVSHYLKV